MMCPKCGKEMGDTTAHACQQLIVPPPEPMRRPWRCPVCQGEGELPAQWPQATDNAKHPCHACGSTGIVWG